MGAIQSDEQDNDTNPPVAVNCNDEAPSSGEVIQLSQFRQNARPVREINSPDAKELADVIEAAVSAHGIDLNESTNARDIRMIKFLIQGLVDRAGGGNIRSSKGCFALESMAHFMADLVPPAPSKDDTVAIFGDLINKLNEAERNK
jgi:hypothetical protein